MLVDLEGHRGSDNRFYVLDAARLFPPERPSGPGTYLYRLMSMLLIYTRPLHPKSPTPQH